MSINSPTPSAPIRVVIVDDHSIIRQGLAAILQLEPRIELVGEAVDGAEAIQVVLKQRPAVVLLDLQLPDLSGIEVMRQVRLSAPDVRFLVLTMHDSNEYIHSAFAAGAHGYLLKDVAPDELVRAIWSTVHGGLPLQPEVAARIFRQSNQGEHGESLSAREMDVLQFLVTGASNRQIGQRLSLSENTIRTHIAHILAKLNVQSRGEAVAVALQRGLVSLTLR